MFRKSEKVLKMLASSDTSPGGGLVLPAGVR
jgi:hypothetical protein